jgi:hypothetical protein
VKRWQPISTVPLDTPVIVTNGRAWRLAVLKTQKPLWDYALDAHATTCTNQLNALAQNIDRFIPTHWSPLPKLPEGK